MPRNTFINCGKAHSKLQGIFVHLTKHGALTWDMQFSMRNSVRATTRRTAATDYARARLQAMAQ